MRKLFVAVPVLLSLLLLPASAPAQSLDIGGAAAVVDDQDAAYGWHAGLRDQVAGPVQAWGQIVQTWTDSRHAETVSAGLQISLLRFGYAMPLNQAQAPSPVIGLAVNAGPLRVVADATQTIGASGQTVRTVTVLAGIRLDLK